MAHTPGPWGYDEDSCEVFGAPDDRGCGWVAKVIGGDSNDRRLPDAERLANARLIAAAPELLAVLRDAKTELIDLYERVYPSDESDNETTAVIDRVIAVIAKAEGRIE